MPIRTLCIVVNILFLTQVAAGQTSRVIREYGKTPRALEEPQTLEILGLSVTGIEDANTRTFVLQTSGLALGQMITLPGDPALADAIRALYRLGLFSDVKIVEERRAGRGLFIAIQVQEVPRLAGYRFEGVKKGDRDKLKQAVPLFAGSRVRPSELERARQAVTRFYKDKGYLLADVQIRQEETVSGAVTLVFEVEKGSRVEVGAIVVAGNAALSDGSVRGKMKGTKEDRWWRFWKKETFDRAAYEEDLARIVAYYNEKGYYDARIVSDTVYIQGPDTKDEEPEVVVELSVHEGPRYTIRHIAWDGNTLFSDSVLTAVLAIETGTPYNSKKLEQNLFANARSTDIASLYMNRGYMRFTVQPSIVVAEGDSLDLYFDVFEGTIYEFGDVSIAGNIKTKDHVIRRELYTIPGQTFSRDAVQESVRRLSQLNYFNQETLAGGPEISIDEDHKEVDLRYRLEEVGSDNMQLSGTYASTGLILQLGLTFNNFSLQNLFDGAAWSPLPSGDGQRLSLSAQTSGNNYQSYSLSFTEPWFGGKPQPVGFSLSYAHLDGSLYSSIDPDGDLNTFSASVFSDRRLTWPDDMFSLSTGLRYQFYDNSLNLSSLPAGISRELVVRQGLIRSSLDHPVFPSRGSQVQLSLDVAPPLPGFVQYHKWRFKTAWNVPLVSKLSIGISTDYGYIGSLTGEDVVFQRFNVGGSPFDTQGVNTFYGQDIVYMRGYPAQSIGPRQDGDPVGGRILNKYTSELRWHMVQTPQLTASPYLFVDAANTWDRLSSYDPTALYRAAGLGARLMLPMIGMLELTYGYHFDAFEPVGDEDGTRGWLFQFSLGQGF